MKKMILFAGALTFATSLVPTSAFATFETPKTVFEQQIAPEASYWFYFESVPAGSYRIESDSFYNPSYKNIFFRVERQSGPVSPSVNYYLVNSSGVSVRGPVTVTGTGSYQSYTFYDVPAGTYRMRANNNSSSAVGIYGVLTY